MTTFATFERTMTEMGAIEKRYIDQPNVDFPNSKLCEIEKRFEWADIIYDMSKARHL